jgi:glycosyltransferase involved in cell wall biosynthesis
MMAYPLVSILLPAYCRNYDGYLERAIRSALSQTYPHYELIVIDDGSIDGSAELIQSYCQADQRVSYISTAENTGIPAYTSSLGYLHSKGEYVAFLFDDCAMYPQFLEKLVHKMEASPQYGMVYGQVLVRTAEGAYTFGREYDHAAMKAGQNVVPNVCVMLRRNVVEDVGWADPHILLKRFNDWDLWIRIGEKYAIGFVPEVIAEENGKELQDSLGNVFSIDLPLSRKYVQNYRNPLLLPGKLGSYDPFRTDFAPLDEQELNTMRFLKLEHYINTLDLKKLLKDEIDTNSLLWRRIMKKNRGILPDRKLIKLLYECALYIHWKRSDLNRIVHAKDEHTTDLHNAIQQQQRQIQELGELVQIKAEHIYQLQLLIEKKDRHIYEQQVIIEAKDRYIQELHRV